MTILTAIFVMLLGYLLVVTAYLVAVTAAAFFFWKRATPGVSLRLGVIMPAHNEEHGIGDTLACLFDSEYPVDRFTVFVVADNCDDRTADIAREAGATVFERTDPDNPGKGQALDWCLTTYADHLREFDGLVLIDADVEVDADFLDEMSLSLNGCDVVQAYYGVANPEENWRTALTFAGFSLMNHVRPGGRVRLGGSAPLTGSGMGFRTDVLLGYGWPAHSIVEDVEFSVRLLLDGHVIDYNPDAVVVSDMPAGRKPAGVQRRRWESGRFGLWRTYLPPLLHAFTVSGKWRFVDAMLDLLVPPLSLVVLGQGVLLGLALFLVVPPVWLLLTAFCVCGTAFHVLGGLHLSGTPASVWLRLPFVPIYVLWKLPIYLRIFTGRAEKTWERTAR